MARAGHPLTSQDAVAALRAGKQLAEKDLVYLLSSPGCPGELVEALSKHRWVLALRRVLVLTVRHPACPRAFAWQVLPRIGWHDLLGVCRDPRTAPPIVRQAERKLTARIPQLTTGERRALARRAPRGVFPSLLKDEDPGCVAALLDNPLFTEAEALRVLHANRNPACLLVLVRHPRWGSTASVRAAAARSPRVPMGVALGLIAGLPSGELRALAQTENVRAPLRAAALSLLNRRHEQRPS